MGIGAIGREARGGDGGFRFGCEVKSFALASGFAGRCLLFALGGITFLRRLCADKRGLIGPRRHRECALFLLEQFLLSALGGAADRSGRHM